MEDNMTHIGRVGGYALEVDRVDKTFKVGVRALAVLRVPLAMRVPRTAADQDQRDACSRAR
jgi:hypothetical protein